MYRVNRGRLQMRQVMEPKENAITLSSDDIAEFAGPGGFGGGGNQGPNWGGEDSSSYGYLEVSGGLLYIEAEGDGLTQTVTV